MWYQKKAKPKLKHVPKLANLKHTILILVKSSFFCMQDPYLESKNDFYSLLEFFHSVKQETTECSVPQRDSRGDSLMST